MFATVAQPEIYKCIAFQMVPAVQAARLGALSLICHAGGTVIGGGDGTVTFFDNACKDYAQAELRGGVVALSLSADQTEVRPPGIFAIYPFGTSKV